MIFKVILSILIMSTSSLGQVSVIESVAKLSSDLDSINKDAIGAKCEIGDTKETKVAKTVIDCDCKHDPKKAVKSFASFQIQNLKPSEVPVEIKQHIPGKAFETGKFNIVLALPNDNKLLGLWGAVFREDSDDYGATHGTSLSLSSTRDNGMTYSLTGETNLYTSKLVGNAKSQNGRIMYRQNFTNENMFKFMLDNIHKDKVLYYKAGVGWIQLDSKNSKGIIQASAQQQSWHKLLNIYGFQNEWDGLPVRNGFNSELFLGLQKNLLFGSSCRVRLFGESGGRISSLNDDYFKIEAGSTLYFQKKGKNWGLTTGLKANAQIHGKGTQFQQDVSAGYNGKRFGAEFIYHAKQGELENHVNYNVKNIYGGIDQTMSIKLKYVFGLSGSKSSK